MNVIDLLRPRDRQGYAGYWGDSLWCTCGRDECRECVFVCWICYADQLAAPGSSVCTQWECLQCEVMMKGWPTTTGGHSHGKNCGCDEDGDWSGSSEEDEEDEEQDEAVDSDDDNSMNESSADEEQEDDPGIPWITVKCQLCDAPSNKEHKLAQWRLWGNGSSFLSLETFIRPSANEQYATRQSATSSWGYWFDGVACTCGGEECGECVFACGDCYDEKLDLPGCTFSKARECLVCENVYLAGTHASELCDCVCVASL